MWPWEGDVPTAVFRVLRVIQEIGAKPGDYLIVRAGPTMPFTLQRDLSPSQMSVLAKADSIELEPLATPIGDHSGRSCDSPGLLKSRGRRGIPIREHPPPNAANPVWLGLGGPCCSGV